MNYADYDIPPELAAEHEANVKAFNLALEKVMQTTTMLGAFWGRKLLIQASESAAQQQAGLVDKLADLCDELAASKERGH